MSNILKELMGGALGLQQMTIASEQKQLDAGVDYSKQQVRMSTVHARQDIVLLAYHLNAINTQTSRILTALLFLILIAGVDLLLRFS